MFSSWSVQRKLAAMICLIALGICIAIYFAVRASFTEGFFGYLNASREADAQRLVDSIQTRIQDQQQWRRFTRSPRHFHDIYRDLVFGRHVLGRQAQQLQKQQQLYEGAKSAQPAQDTKPTRFRDPAFSDRRGPPPRGLRRPPANIPFTLLDEQRQPYFARDRFSTDWRSLPIVLNDNVIGHIAIAPIRDNTPVADQLFIETQNRWFRVIAVASALFFSLLAWPLAALLMRPLKTLSNAVEQLSERKYATRVNINSDDDFGKLASEFNHMAQALGEFDERQRNWIADISHELRTPLAIMQAEIEAVQDGVRSPSPELIASLKAETLQLRQLVDDLHAIVLNESSGIHINRESVDVNALIQQQVEMHNQALKRKALHITVNPDPNATDCQLDKSKFTQVIANLLQNSIRYTDNNGHIVCTISISHQQLLVTWQDSSPGVDQEHLPRLFDRLYRVEASRNRAAGGSGLGMAVCKAIVENHQGSITAEHSSLGGLKVGIVIPVF